MLRKTLHPKVSIITVCLNSEKFLEQTIQSVLKQTYQNIEYIIIDGGSWDNTQEIITRYEENIDYWVSEPDKGISDAFNKGLLSSTGEIIGFLNSQDYYFDRNVIEKVVNAFTNKQAASIVYGKVYYVPIDSSEVVGVVGERFTKKRMMKRNIMPHQSVFMKRHVFHRFGQFRLNYRIAMDYEYTLRATKFYKPIFLDEGLAVMRFGGISDMDKFAVCTELCKAQMANNVPFLRSFITLIYHYITSAGLKFLRLFNIYSLGHLYKKLGMKPYLH